MKIGFNIIGGNFMISLRKIDEDNFRKVVDMKLTNGGQKFVAANVYSLAQAWVFYEEARPFAIYKDEEVVGFIMFEWDELEKEAGIWRFMIAEEYQGKGYGIDAMKAAIEMIRSEGKFEYISLSYVPGNDVGKHIYEKLGFKATGEVDHGEVVMKLDL